MTWTDYEHSFNKNAHDTWSRRSWEQVDAEAKAAHHEFSKAVEACPENVLFGSNQPAWQTVAFNGYLHYEYFEQSLLD